MLRPEPIESEQLELEQLTRFNPALIYGFEPENLIFSDQNKPEHLIYRCEQHKDIFNAYWYAQNEILPDIQTTGINKITPNKILEWLDRIHLYIAKTLSEAAQTAGMTAALAGKPTTEQMVRWHPTGEIQQLFMYDSKPNVTTLKKYGVNEQDFNAFIDLLDDIQKQKDKEIKEKYYDTYTKRPHAANLLMLIDMYHGNELSLEQKIIIGKIITICPHPLHYEKLRQTFAQGLLEEWKKCNPNNLEEIVKLAFYVFYTVTEKHWYFNGNGRTATCFMNAILVSFNLPSILLRRPSEKYDPNSSYSTAIQEINSNPTLLQNHIMARIKMAQEGEMQEDTALRELMLGQLQLSYQLQQLITSRVIEKEDIDLCYKIVMINSQNKYLPKNVELTTEIQLNAIMETNEIIKKLKENPVEIYNLYRSASPANETKGNPHETIALRSSPITVSYNDKIKEGKQMLENITGRNWKHTQTQKQFWLQLENKNDAETLKKNLMSNSSLDVKMQQTANHDGYVLMIKEDMVFNKLSASAPQSSANSSSPVPKLH